MKKFLEALKNNTDGVRKKALITAATVAGSIVAGILLTKLNEDRVDVIVVEEKRSDEPVEATEF